MTLSNRVNITAVAGAGLCGLALSLSPVAAALPFMTGGYECIQTQAGAAGPAAAACAPAAPMNEMAGVPMALPGPVPAAAPVPVAPVPIAPVAPVPIAPVVPVVPAAAPVPAAPAPVVAPLMEMAGTGKGDFVGPPAPGAPVPGQPIAPGPQG